MDKPGFVERSIEWIKNHTGRTVAAAALTGAIAVGAVSGELNWNQNTAGARTEGAGALPTDATDSTISGVDSTGSSIEGTTTTAEEQTPEDDAAEHQEDILDLFTIGQVDADICDDVTEQTSDRTTEDYLRLVNVAETDEAEDVRNVPRVGALFPVRDADEVRSFETREWNDSMSTPLVAAENVEADEQIEASEDEIKANICADPILAATAGHFFAHLEIDGVRAVDSNPWLADYNVETDQINDLAARFMPAAPEASSILSADEREAAEETALEANAAHQQFAARISALIDNFAAQGVRVVMTSTNYHRAGNEVEGLPEIDLNPDQYQGEAFMFFAYDKDGDCLAEFGFNIHDQRIVATEICAPVTPPTTETTTVTSSPPGLPPITTTVPRATTTTTRPGETTTTGVGTTTTTRPGTTTTTVPGSTTASTRVEATVPANPVIQGPGAGGEADPDDDGTNNATTSTTAPRPTSTTTNVPATTSPRPSTTLPPVSAPTSTSTTAPGGTQPNPNTIP